MYIQPYYVYFVQPNRELAERISTAIELNTKTAKTIESCLIKISHKKNNLTNDEKYIVTNLFEIEKLDIEIKNYLLNNKLVKNVTDTIKEGEAPLFQHKKEKYILVSDFKADPMIKKDIDSFKNGAGDEYLAFEAIARKVSEEHSGIYDEDGDYTYTSEAKKSSNLRNALWKGYESGGASGGSCWGTEPETYHKEAPKKSPQVLDKLFEIICPDITFLQYKKVTCNTEKYDSLTEPEYYGNYTEYNVTYHKFSDLYKAFKENGIELNLESAKFQNTSKRKSKRKP